MVDFNVVLCYIVNKTLPCKHLINSSDYLFNKMETFVFIIIKPVAVSGTPILMAKDKDHSNSDYKKIST